MKIVVIGGTGSTLRLLMKLNEYGLKKITVFGYHPKKINNVSGWVDVATEATLLGFEASCFTKVEDCENKIKIAKPDILFVVGLSQIVPQRMLDIPKSLAIGFHPTELPLGRGRAPIAWLVLTEVGGAATFFRLTDGVDNGAILSQVKFSFNRGDDASKIEQKILDAEEKALDCLISDLQGGTLSEKKQDDSKATYFGCRTPDDGRIDWYSKHCDILSLVRAATLPHPGSFTFCENTKIIIWEAELFSEFQIRGVVGRVLHVYESDNSFLVQTGTEVVKVTNWEAVSWTPKVGVLLGYNLENEIYRMRLEIDELRAALSGHSN